MMISPISMNSFVPKFFFTTSVSLVMIKSYVLDKFERLGLHPDIEIKINNFSCEGNTDETVETICSLQASMIGFAVYPWNVSLIKGLVPEIKKRDPASFIVLGGPSVSFDSKNVLRKWIGADAIVKGPGEETFFQLLMSWLDNKKLDRVPNLIYRQGEQIVENPYKNNFSVESQHYPLRCEEFYGLSQLNYDTARGCNFHCKYCAWNLEGTEPPGVKYYPMKKVKMDLENIFKSESLIKLSLNDSNITINESRCLEIFRDIVRLNQQRREKKMDAVQIILDLDPQYFTERIIDEMKKINIGALGFGLQSLNEDVLRIADRKFNKERYVANLERLSRKGGIKIFIELIFGLPGDTMEIFKHNIEFVLSELKTYSFICFRFLVLPGSPFWYERDTYDIIHQKDPPYEVLSTNTFSAEELNDADKLASWFELFFSLFRSVKKTIESHAMEKGLPQVPIYEQIFERLSRKYEDFFEKGWKQEETYYYIDKLRDPKNRHIRRGILTDSRKFLAEILYSTCTG